MRCIGVKSIIPADKRLGKEETKKINDKEMVEVIAMQERLLEMERQQEIVRDSCVLYDQEELIEG